MHYDTYQFIQFVSVLPIRVVEKELKLSGFVLFFYRESMVLADFYEMGIKLQER